MVYYWCYHPTPCTRYITNWPIRHKETACCNNRRINHVVAAFYCSFIYVMRNLLKLDIIVFCNIAYHLIALQDRLKEPLTVTEAEKTMELTFM